MGGSSWAPMPLPGDYPPGGGWSHVGWRCTSPGHECLRYLGDVDDEVDCIIEDGQRFLRLVDSNHKAGWTPIFAKLPEE